MTFRADERGATVQVGAVLFLAILVVAMLLYQATVVPDQNASVEFRHNERTQGDLQDVRNAVLRAGFSGSVQPTTIDLGTRYATRVFFLNPPPATGSLWTEGSGVITVSNATTSGETGDYWNGTDREFATSTLVYAPNYREYDDAPETVYENTVLYNRFDGANVSLTDQRLVRDRRVSLVALNGSISRSRTGTVSVGPHALSPSTTGTRTVAVTSTGGPLTLAIPTKLDDDEWRDLLEDQLIENGGYVESVGETANGRVMLRLREGVTYDLRLAKVGVGSGTAETGATYLTSVGGTDRVGPSATLTAEVRDGYNNPVSGVTVEVVEDTGDGVGRGSAVTDERGRVTFQYRGSNGANAETVTLGIGDDDGGVDDYELVEYEIDPRGNGDGGGGQNPPRPVRLVYQEDATAVDANDDGTPSGVRFGVRGNASRPIRITDIEIDPRKGSIKRLSDPTTDVGKWKSELYVEADRRNGGTDVGNGVDLPATIDIDEDGWYGEVDAEPILSGDGTATVHLYEFHKRSGKSVDMTGEDVTVRISYVFDDGTTGSETFTVTPD